MTGRFTDVVAKKSLQTQAYLYWKQNVALTWLEVPTFILALYPKSSRRDMQTIVFPLWRIVATKVIFWPKFSLVVATSYITQMLIVAALRGHPRNINHLNLTSHSKKPPSYKWRFLRFLFLSTYPQMRVGFTSLSKNSVIPNYWILTETGDSHLSLSWQRLKRPKKRKKPVMRKIWYSFKSNSPEVKLNRGYLVSSAITIVSWGTLRARSLSGRWAT